jgi:hypothetical protein
MRRMPKNLPQDDPKAEADYMFSFAEATENALR